MRSMAIALGLAILFFGGGFLWLHFHLKSWPKEMIPREDMLLHFHQTVLIVACLTPLLLIVCWVLSWRVTYRTVGALERIALELQRRIQRGERTPIKIRKGDGIQALVAHINHLLKPPEKD